MKNFYSVSYLILPHLTSATSAVSLSISGISGINYEKFFSGISP